jgi:1-acyl-sn-glycerol-3-phosphate acyltransferase
MQLGGGPSRQLIKKVSAHLHFDFERVISCLRQSVRLVLGETAMRSTIFNALYITVSAAFVFALAPLSLLPGTSAIRGAARLYAKTILFLMRHVAGIKVELRGTHRLPTGPFLIAAKHQSWGDGYAMVSYFDDLSFVAGDHLEKFPLVANILQKLDCGGQLRRSQSPQALGR